MYVGFLLFLIAVIQRKLRIEPKIQAREKGRGVGRRNYKERHQTLNVVFTGVQQSLQTGDTVQSVMLVFSTSLVNCCPSTFSLTSLSQTLSSATPYIHIAGPTYKDDILLVILILLFYAGGGKGRGAEPMPGGPETAKQSLNDNANRALRPASEVYSKRSFKNEQSFTFERKASFKRQDMQLGKVLILIM